MGFLDKLKEAGQQAATRAIEELDEFQKKRELSQEYTDLGRKAFQLMEEGRLSHEALGEHAERIRKLKAELEAIEAESKTTTAEKSSAQPPESSSG